MNSFKPLYWNKKFHIQYNVRINILCIFVRSDEQYNLILDPIYRVKME